MLTKALSHIKKFPVEALIWSAGLVALALYEPAQNHVSLCPLNQFGFDFCPGCGLGRSISFFFHGNLTQSFSTHPLGIVAVLILVHRIIHLTKIYLKSHGKNY